VRPSNKTLILNAAVAVIESAGITAVTFDSVAAAAELTRGGILYHFPSRDDLVRALHEHLAGKWEQQLVAACGKEAADATELERLMAYVRVASVAATRAELQMLLDSRNTEHHRPWGEVIDRWTPRPGGKDTNDVAWMALLAADGLWVNDAINERPLPAAHRARIVERIVAHLEAGHATLKSQA